MRIEECFMITKNEHGTHIIFVKNINNIKIKFRGSILPSGKHIIRHFEECELKEDE